MDEQPKNPTTINITNDIKLPPNSNKVYRVLDLLFWTDSDDITISEDTKDMYGDFYNESVSLTKEEFKKIVEFVEKRK